MDFVNREPACAPPGSRSAAARKHLFGYLNCHILGRSRFRKEDTTIPAPTAGSQAGLACTEQQFLLARAAGVLAVDSPGAAGVRAVGTCLPSGDQPGNQENPLL